MSLYFKSEEDTMKNEIPADIFLVPPPPPPPRLRKNIYQIIEGFYYILFSLYTCHCSFSIIKQYTESYKSYKWFIWALEKYNNNNFWVMKKNNNNNKK